MRKIFISTSVQMVHHVNTHVYMYVSYVYSLYDLSIMSNFE